MRLPVWLAFCLVAGLTSSAQAGLKIYYMRHGEIGQNVADQWKNVPKEEWPAYVGKSDVFTPLGETQVAAVARKLEPYQFDFIAVSPLWRARHTILPYLQATGRKAEIWPELTEIKSAERTLDSASTQAPTPDLFTGGRPIVLPPEESAYFTLRPDGLRELRFGWATAREDSDRRAATEKLVGLIRQRFGNSDKSILLVGHGNEGRYLLNILAGYTDPRVKSLRNTSIWMAEEQPDGTFKVRMLNDHPFDAQKYGS